MIDKRTTLVIALMITLAAVIGAFLITDNSADGETYFMDGDIRYVVTDEKDLTVSVAPLETGKYAAAVSLVIPTTATDGEKTYKVTGIADSTFAFATGLYGVEIPEGIETIGAEAFHYAAIYQDLTLPSTVKEIGEQCFYSSSITGLDLSKTSIKVIPEYAFDDCKYLKWVKLNDDVETIEKAGFGADITLNSFDFGGSPVKSIGEKAFQNTGTGIELNLPGTLEKIEDGAFTSAKVTKYTIGEGCKEYKSVDGCILNAAGDTLLFYPLSSPANYFAVPAGVTKLGDDSFYGASYLNTLRIDNATIIEGYALTMTKVTTLIIEQSAALPEGNKGIIGTYMTAENGYWSMSNITIQHAIIDSEYAIDLTGLMGKNGEYMDFTEKSVNTIGGNFTKDGEPVSAADRAGCRFTCTSSQASDSFTFDNTRFLTVTVDPKEGGTVEGAGSVEIGVESTVTAVPKSGYAFGYWNDDVTLTNPEYTLSITQDTVLKATFLIQENTFFTVPSTAEFKMTQYTGTGPENARASSYNYYNFAPVDYSSKVDNGDGTITYCYKLVNGSYGAIVSGDDFVTYKDLFSKSANKEYTRTVTLEQLQPEGKSAEYVERAVQVKCGGDDVPGMLVSLSKQNYLNLSVGQQINLMAYRQWQAVGNTMQNPFLEPPIVYKITDLDGNEVTDVLEIIEGGASETTYKLKALKEGTVVVTMYMEAFTLNVTQDTFYGATWPELTEVFVVTVGNSGSFDTGMQIYDNGEMRPIDAEVDIFYYDHNTEGFLFEFEPAAGTTVTIFNPELGEIGITGFKEGAASEENGVWTLTLTEGRNIVKMTNGSTTLYQILTALPVVIEVNGTDLKDAQVSPGEEVKIVFKSSHGDYGGILNSKSKLAGIYNSNATIYYEDDEGNRIATAKQPAYGHYFFVSDMNYQTLTLTVPEDYKDSTFDIYSKGIILGGFDGLGDHRTWFLTNATSLGVKYISRLPYIAIPIEVPPVNYGVKNSTGVDVSYSIYADGRLVDDRTIATGATETFSLKPGSYILYTYIGENTIDIRTMTIETDKQTSITSVAVNTKGIDPEAAGLFIVEYSHSNPKYVINTAVTNMDGKEADETNMDVKIFEYDGDTVVADLIPTDTAEGKFAEFISAYTSPAAITLNCYKTVARTILVPAGADVSIGMKVAHYRAFKEVAPAAVSTEGDKDVYTFNLASKQVYALTVDVPTNDNLITLGAKITFNSDDFTTLDVVESGLMVAEGKTSKTTVDKPTTNNEVSDIYGNVGASGAIYLDAGETATVDTFRVWQALDSIVSNYFIEPVYTYSIVTGEDVISIDNGVVTALKDGVAFVAVSYDAMNFLEITNQDLKQPTFYPASNAENAYVFVVVVGSDAPEFDTGMVINSGLNTVKTKLSVDYIDSDVDFIYYAGDKCTYTFTTDKNAEVTVFSPVFSSNTVTNFIVNTVTGSSGTFTVPLTEGRNIVKITVDGETAYQIVRAQKIDVTIENKTSEERSSAGTALPGDVLEITIGGLYGLQKMAGIYNPQTDGVIMVDEFGGTFAANASKQYGLSIETLTVQVTVPADAEDFYELCGYVVTGGYGDPVGGHHLITRENGRQPNFVAEYVKAYLGSIQGISVPVVEYYTVDFMTPLLVESVVTNETQVKLGSSYNFGTVKLVGGDLYFYLNCANYTLISAEFGHSGKTTKDMCLNTEALEINGVSMPAGRAVMAQGLGSGTFWFKVTYGTAWSSAVFEGTAELDTGTYYFTEAVEKGQKLVLPELTVEAKYAADKEKLKFNAWLVDDERYQPGDEVEITSSCDIYAEFIDDFIIFDGDTGTYTDPDGVVTEFASLNDAVKSTTVTADILITGDCSFTGSITLKRNLTIVDGGVLNANGSLSIAKGYTLTVEDGAELHNGTSQMSNNGTLVIDGIADSRGNFNNNGTLEGTVTALPYFLVGDTLSFSAGRGSIEHTPGQDKCKYDADSKVTITLTVESLPGAVNNGWDDYGTLKVTDIQFSDKSDLVYVLSYSIGKATVLGETILSFYKVTGIDDSVIQKINERGGMNVVLPQALRDVQFGDGVTIVTEAYYTDTHGSKVYYSIDETTPAYMNGFTTYTLYSYDTENPDYRFCEQGTVTHVEYAEGMTTYDTKMSPWSANDMTSCDYWVSGSFADMIGTALTYGIEFYGDNVTYSVDSLRAATNAIITIDGDKLYVNDFVVTATPDEGDYKLVGWSVDSGAAVTGDMRIKANVLGNLIIFDGDTGTYTDSEGVVTEFASLNDAVKSTTVTADILIIGDCSFTGSITLKRNLTIADGGVLNANGSMSISKGYTLTVENGAELHNGTSQLSNSGTLVIDGIADTRGNFSNSGTLEGTVTVLPYFVIGDTLSFTAGRGSIEHTPGQDKCKYDADSKVTITLTVESLPSAVNNGWDDFGTLKITDIQFSDKSDLVYVLSYSIGKVTVLGETIYSYYKVTGIDDSVIQKINERGGMNVVLPQALRDVQFGDGVTIVTEAYYTDTHGSKVYYSVDETTPAYMNGYTTYTLYSYQKENPDYRFCEQGTVTHVEYAEGMTTYDTKMSAWAANDMTSCDYWVSGSFPDMIGTVLTYGLDFYGDNVTYNVDSIRAATNATITIDGTKLYVNAFEVIATPAVGEYKFVGWSVDSGATVTGDMRIQAIVDEVPDTINVTLVAQDGLLIDGRKSISVEAHYGDIVTVNGNKLTIGDTTYTAVISPETGYIIKFDKWSGIPEGGILKTDVTMTAECSKIPEIRLVTLVAGKNCADVNGLPTLTVEVIYGTRVMTNGPVIFFGTASYSAHANSSEGYTYIFDSWVGVPASYEITEDVTITANFLDPVKDCVVTFVAGDHGTVSTSKAIVPAGSSIVVSGNTLTIGGYEFAAYPEPSTSNQTVTFDHWNIPGSAKTVTNDMTIEAIFKVTYTPKQVDGSVNVDVSNTGDAESTIRLPTGTKSVVVNYGSGMSLLIKDESLAGKDLTTSMDVVNAGSGAAYELVVLVNGQEYTGKMLVTIPAEPDAGKVPVVYYVDGSNQTKMETVSYTDSSITFSTNHNSKYVLQYENAPDNTTLYIVLVVLAIVLILIIVVSLLRKSRRS